MPSQQADSVALEYFTPPHVWALGAPLNKCLSQLVGPHGQIQRVPLFLIE